MMVEKTMENFRRRQASRLGLELKKSKAKKISTRNLGGWKILDGATREVLAGPAYDLTFDEVVIMLDEREALFIAEKKVE